MTGVECFVLILSLCWNHLQWLESVRRAAGQPKEWVFGEVDTIELASVLACGRFLRAEGAPSGPVFHEMDLVEVNDMVTRHAAANLKEAAVRDVQLPVLNVFEVNLCQFMWVL